MAVIFHNRNNSTWIFMVTTTSAPWD